LQIILVGRISAKKVNVLWFAVVQFTTSGLLNLLVAFSLDSQGVHAFATAWPPVLYSALVPIGLGFTLQIAGQRYAPPVDAALIMSMEAVFGTLFAYLFLHEMLTPQQIIGCGLILAAMILAQLRPVDVTAGVVDKGAASSEELDQVSAP
jgi:drug/metabolite transporter (DMT)-like permease